MLLNIFLTFLFVISVGHLSVCEDEKSISTSIVSMMELLQTERILVDLSRKYAKELEKKLEVIKSAYSKMNRELKQAKLSPETYVSNPVKAFSLIRRMQADWVQWELYLKEVVGHTYIEEMKALRSELPTELDLKEAVTGIHRLQTTYGLKPKDMAVGHLNGKKYDSQLTARDLYTIGFELFKQKYIPEASIWLKSALDSYGLNEIYDAYKFSKKTIYELYANVLVLQARNTEALIALNQAVNYEPKDARLHKKKRLLEFKVTTTLTEFMKPWNQSTKAPVPYNEGCRGEFPSRPFELRCRYNSTTSDFLKLAPLKMEEISLDPYMVMYHDVISDSEIEHLKELGSGKLRRATAFDRDEKTYVATADRTTKSASIAENWSEVTRRLHRRIGDMSGFILTHSDVLQLINYGLGGHYVEHADYHNFEEHDSIPSTGNRIATVMIYLSDVEQGGATVFSKLNLAIPPQKGSALLWHNLNNRGEGNFHTRHAACPVLVGSKWIVTKWIRETYQFRIKPCPRE